MGTFAYDMYPEGTGTPVPPETWSGIDAAGAAEDLARRSIFTEEEIRQRAAEGRPIGLLELARNQRPYAGPTAETEERLKKSAPDVLAVLKREAARQQANWDRDHR